MRLWRVDTEEQFSVASAVLGLGAHETNNTWREGIQRVVSSDGDVHACIGARAALSHQDVASAHVLAVHHLWSQPPADGVSTVIRATLSLFRRVPYGEGEGRAYSRYAASLCQAPQRSKHRSNSRSSARLGVDSPREICLWRLLA
jgi:hypothetical protein